MQLQLMALTPSLAQADLDQTHVFSLGCCSPLGRWAGRLVEHPAFDRVALGLILLNCVVLALEVRQLEVKHVNSKFKLKVDWYCLPLTAAALCLIQLTASCWV